MKLESFVKKVIPLTNAYHVKLLYDRRVNDCDMQQECERAGYDEENCKNCEYGQYNFYIEEELKFDGRLEDIPIKFLDWRVNSFTIEHVKIEGSFTDEKLIIHLN